ncbi:hypothetical protein SEA_SWISSCHEESE_74 [Mycobacterium phage SwissCheese]|uniref:Uncharacterized protein n=2 Tax=Fromanvirus TaxID=186764 RepID=G8I621_9CAUD|nr:hypothetical protein CM08_gp73 [Mycobacterium phage Bruns]YP_009019154.1 hypothetical protein CL86_gp079 [Mycobacterium phage SkiPole]AXH45241.1 hypothetical protein SEA_SWISSCHEESE_74 [Mycobacterium phage SwissCheese]QAY03181.1 hypothetical protein SEA_METALQZJ_67 [Mycobacterium phage MetalQZJ]QDM56652.1 hypothetical protein SEA_BIG3_71 [Mycobacterium phage Big3]QGH75701.1 hypothetical protein SEA_DREAMCATCHER_74 [Mycobacterium phage DreamCatcher]QNJ55775.1 hypothetical protein SEA_MARYBE
MDKTKLIAMSTVVLMFEWALNRRFELHEDLDELIWFSCDEEAGEVDPEVENEFWSEGGVFDEMRSSVRSQVDEYLEKFRDSVYAELPPCPNGHSPRPKLDS